MTSLLSFVVIVLAIFVISMLGLALGVVLKKKTPLKGSCRGVACEARGDEARQQGCACSSK
jgi:hypothetical protein